jgi:hypothetical protein
MTLRGSKTLSMLRTEQLPTKSLPSTKKVDCVEQIVTSYCERECGYHDTRNTLQHKDWLKMSEHNDGISTHDIYRRGA